MIRTPGAVMHEDMWYRLEEAGEKEFDDYDEDEEKEKEEDEDEDGDASAVPEEEVEQLL